MPQRTVLQAPVHRPVYVYAENTSKKGALEVECRQHGFPQEPLRIERDTIVKVAVIADPSSGPVRCEAVLLDAYGRPTKYRSAKTFTYGDMGGSHIRWDLPFRISRRR